MGMLNIHTHKGINTSGTPAANDFAKFTDIDTVEGRSYAEVLTDLGIDPADGWISTGTFTYASATTITVASGAASIYQKGDKIKLTQTTAKYFYVVGVSDTVLTVTGGSDYTVANAAITLPFYSHKQSPVSFPTFFNYTPTGPTNTVLTGRFALQGRLCKCSIKGAVTGAVDWSNMPTLPITASASMLSTGVTQPAGIGGYENAGTAFVLATTCPIVVASATVCTIVRQDTGLWSATSPITWANNDAWWATFDYEI